VEVEFSRYQELLKLEVSANQDFDGGMNVKDVKKIQFSL
jgi:hypothetical protein